MRSGLLLCPPFVRFICGRMWCRGVLPATLPAPFSATLSPALWVYLCKCGAAGPASGQTACPFSPTLRQSRSRHRHAMRVLSAHVPVSAPPTCLDVCFPFISLVEDFLAFDFLSVLVVRGGAVCLPTPPSWFSALLFPKHCIYLYCN